MRMQCEYINSPRIFLGWKKRFVSGITFFQSIRNDLSWCSIGQHLVEAKTLFNFLRNIMITFSHIKKCILADQIKKYPKKCSKLTNFHKLFQKYYLSIASAPTKRRVFRLCWNFFLLILYQNEQSLILPRTAWFLSNKAGSNKDAILDARSMIKSFKVDLSAH